MKSKKITFAKAMKSVVKKSIVRDANSTSCMIYHQPKAPATLKKFSKINND